MVKVINTETFIEKAKLIHGDLYNYENTIYYKSKEKLSICCKIHGEFIQTAADHLKGWGCSKCSGKYRPTKEEWINNVSKIYNNIYDYSKINYIDNKTPVEVICKTHGSFYPIPNNHIKGISGCPKCNNILKSINYRKSTEQFIKESINIHGNKYDYNKVNYINKITNVIITCLEHGEFEQRPSVHLNGSGCSKCRLKNQTKLFKKLKETFQDEIIDWEYSPEWLGRQRFDIFIPKYNIAIEYNGQLHYNSIEYFGGDKKFNIQQERDNLKRKKCIDNNCTLFELKYDYDENDYIIVVNEITNIINKEKLIQNEI